MKIINQTRNTILAEDVLLADNFLTRIIGLLGRTELAEGKALLIRPCNSVHTFFMRFAIDVIFIDKNKRIVKAVSCLKPYHISRIYWRSDFVVEACAGTISSSNTQEGDIVSIDI